MKDFCKGAVCNSFGVLKGAAQHKYLGLPLLIGKNKQEIFAYIKERVWSRIQVWNKQYLSKASKEILLKTVAQAIPNYAISIFLLPLTLCSDLEKR